MATESEIIQRDAEWAQTFRNATSNLAQRGRREAAIAEAADLRAQEAEAGFERALATDAGLRSLYFGRERLAQGQQRLGQAERRMQQQQMNFEAQQQQRIDQNVFRNEMATRKLALDELNSQRAMRKELRDAANAETILRQTTQAEQDLDDHVANGIMPGTKDFAERALRILAQNPMMDRNARATILGSAKIIGDQEEFETAWNKLTKEQQARATVVDDPKGWRISIAPEKPVNTASQLDALRKEYDAASRARAAMEGDKGTLKPGFSEDDRLFYDDQKRDIMGRIRSLNPSAAGPASSAPAAAQPSDPAQRPIFKDAKGNRAYKNPDGSFEPIR